MLMKSLIAVVMLLLANVVYAQPNAIPPAPHILVYGSASAQAIPDQFTIKLTINVSKMDAGEARQRAELLLQDVLAKLREAGVHEQNIIASRLAITPNNRYDRDSNQAVFEGTTVKRIVKASFDDMDSLSSFLSQTEINQELQLEGVQTALRNEADLMAKLRAEAIANCKQKAAVVAAAYDVDLQGIYSVSDVEPRFDYGVVAGRWPSRFYWDGNRLFSFDRIETAGSRLPTPFETSFSTGYITLTDKIYTVFLISEEVKPAP